jgi:hypothetical protein
MRTVVAGLVLSMLITMTASHADEKPDVAIPLKRADLEKLEGIWVLQADPKEGFKGKVSIEIDLHEAEGKQKDFGLFRYSYELVDGKKESSLTNAPVFGVQFGGVKQGKSQFLVSTTKPFLEGGSPPFELDPTKQPSAEFTLDGDKLTLDFSKNLEVFVPNRAKEMKIDWSKTTWIKAKPLTLAEELKLLDGTWKTKAQNAVQIELTLMSNKRGFRIKGNDTAKESKAEPFLLGDFATFELFQLEEVKGKRFIAYTGKLDLAVPTPTRFEYKLKSDRNWLIIDLDTKGYVGKHTLFRVEK